MPPWSSTRRRASAEPEAQAAVGAVGRRLGVHEGLEEPLPQLAGKADAVVLDPDRHPPVLELRGEVDTPLRRRVLGGVVEEIDEHLLEPRRVAAQLDGVGGQSHGEDVPALLDQRAGGLDRVADDVVQQHPLAPQPNLAERDARDVEQVLDEVREVAHLALDDRARPLQRGGVQAQGLDGVADRGERVAQLVGQESEEAVLPAVGLGELGGLPPQLLLQALALGDVVLAAPGAAEEAVLEHPDEVVDEELAVPLPVHLVRLGTLQAVAGADEGEEVVDVVGVGARQEGAQSRADDLGRRGEAVHPRHLVVALGEVAVAVEVVDLLVLGKVGGAGALELEAPAAGRGELEEGVVALFAGAQGAEPAAAFGVVVEEDDQAAVRQRRDAAVDRRLQPLPPAHDRLAEVARRVAGTGQRDGLAAGFGVQGQDLGEGPAARRLPGGLGEALGLGAGVDDGAAGVGHEHRRAQSAQRAVQQLLDLVLVHAPSPPAHARGAIVMRAAAQSIGRSQLVPASRSPNEKLTCCLQELPFAALAQTSGSPEIDQNSPAWTGRMIAACTSALVVVQSR